jgi:hypothetical protein
MFGSTWGQNNSNNSQQQTSAFGQPANTFGSGQSGIVYLSEWNLIASDFLFVHHKQLLGPTISSSSSNNNQLQSLEILRIITRVAQLSVSLVSSLVLQCSILMATTTSGGFGASTSAGTGNTE